MAAAVAVRPRRCKPAVIRRAGARAYCTSRQVVALLWNRISPEAVVTRSGAPYIGSAMAIPRKGLRGLRASSLMALLLATSMLISGCGGSAPTSTKGSAAIPGRGQTEAFASSAGAAFATFHLHLYQPFKAGGLGDRGPRRPELAKARAAALATARAVVTAKQAAVRTPALRRLFAPLAALQATLSALANELARGHTDELDINSANTEIASIERVGSSSGVRLTERLPAKGP